MANYSVKEVSFTKPENQILINPRWPKIDQQFLIEQAEKILQVLKLKNHFVLTSSGSDSSSYKNTKLIFLSKDAVMASAASANAYFHLQATENWLKVLPTFHVSGLGILARAHLSGATVTDFAQDWNVDSVVKLLNTQKFSLMSMVPTQVFDILQHPGKDCLKTLSKIFIGGTALTENLLQKLKPIEKLFHYTYGMTETASMIAAKSLFQTHFEVLPHVDVDRDDQGFLKVRSLATPTAIHLAGNKDKSLFTYRPNQDWITMEDRIEIFGAKQIQVLGRSKDLIKINGESVSLPALRKIWSQNISESAFSDNDFHLSSLPDERSMNKIVLYSLVGESKIRVFLQRFAERVLPFEKIAQVYEVPHMPRTELGKVIESQLIQFVK